MAEEIDSRMCFHKSGVGIGSRGLREAIKTSIGGSFTRGARRSGTPLYKIFSSASSSMAMSMRYSADAAAHRGKPASPDPMSPMRSRNRTYQGAFAVVKGDSSKGAYRKLSPSSVGPFIMYSTSSFMKCS